mgnify:CR=1 FL=1
MNLKDLWIGDNVRIKSSDKYGKFEGITPDGKAKVSVNYKLQLIEADNVEFVEEKEVVIDPLKDFDLSGGIQDKKQTSKPKIKPDADWDRTWVQQFQKERQEDWEKESKENKGKPQTQEIDLQKTAAFKRELDLHLTALDDYYDSPLQALDFQKDKCISFVKEAIRLRVGRVILVHGIGKGQLRRHIKQILKNFKEVDKTVLTHDGGATEVWFSYD